MRRRVIYLIIFLMSTAVVGVSITQFYWINKSLQINRENFDDKIMVVLSRVKDRLIQDAQTQDAYKEYLRSKFPQIQKENFQSIDKVFDGLQDWERENMEYEIWSNYLLADPSSFLENIDNKKLDEYLRSELSLQELDLEYEYGVFSNKTGGFLILNGQYVVELNQNIKATQISTGRNLKETVYKLSLFEGLNEDEPGYLTLYFPKRSNWVWGNLIYVFISSIIFTAIILFCFSYTILVILRQKKISEMKTDFINNMTHEFKTPIATISLAADSISSPSIISNADKVKRFLGIIKEENKRMLSQVEKVLQIATLEKNEFKLRITEVDIHELICKAVDYASLKVNERGGSIETELKANKCIIEADATHIANIISNLLDNAEKYTKEAPKIRVMTEDYKDGIKISIEDNGIGISKEDLKHIFEKFYRVHTGNIHNIKGFGLGLSYVKAMVDAHYGNVFVKSTLEQGSTFIIFLPYKHRK